MGARRGGSYETTNTELVTIGVNGKAVLFDGENGCANLDREWKAGDVVELNLPMPIRRVVANGKVKAEYWLAGIYEWRVE